MDIKTVAKFSEASEAAAKKRNPAILRILDPMHRSLLNKNLQYEQGTLKNNQKWS